MSMRVVNARLVAIIAVFAAGLGAGVVLTGSPTPADASPLGLGVLPAAKGLPKPYRCAAEVYFSQKNDQDKGQGKGEKKGNDREIKDPENALVAHIDQAKRQVLVACYMFTSRKLSYAVKRAYARGVEVKVLLDGSGRDVSVSKGKEIAEAGVPLHWVDLGGSGYHAIKFHHKYAVIDGARVATGSFNWTKQANTENHENLVILHSKQVAQRFRQNFIASWREAEAKAKAEAEAEAEAGEESDRDRGRGQGTR